MKNYDVIVIGGGAGGLTVSIGAALLGAKVALIEKDNKLGGDCLHYGCVPSKTIIKCAKIAHTVRNSEKYGVKSELKKVDYEKVYKYLQGIIAGIQKHDSPERLSKYGIDTIFGNSHFIDKNTIKISGKKLRAKKFVISTGSTPFIPPIKGIDKIPYLTNQNVFSLKKLPKSIAIIGGGPIGCELAQSFSRLGSKITLLESNSSIMSKEDSELTKTVMKIFKDEGMHIMTKTRVPEVKKTKNGILIKTNKGKKIEAEKLLIATGRWPNTKGLGLEKIGVKLDDRGGVKTNEKMQSSLKHIYAVGDAAGSYQFTHIAEYHAKIVVWNLFFPFKKKIKYNFVPWTTFIDPELSCVGVCSTQANDKNYKVYTLEGKEIDRFRTEGYEHGKVKMYADNKGYIKGVTMLLPNSGELIHEFLAAMQNNVKIQDMSQMIHVYPTMSQANKKIMNKFMAEKYMTPFSKTLAKFFFRFS